MGEVGARRETGRRTVEQSAENESGTRPVGAGARRAGPGWTDVTRVRCVRGSGSAGRRLGSGEPSGMRQAVVQEVPFRLKAAGLTKLPP